MLVDVEDYELVRRRSQFAVYLRYNINRFELTYLLALSSYLSHVGRLGIGKMTYHRQVTSNSREKRKFEGYLKGCVSKGFITMAECKTGYKGIRLGITPIGYKVVESHLVDVGWYIEKLRINKGKERIAA